MRKPAESGSGLARARGSPFLGSIPLNVGVANRAPVCAVPDSFLPAPPMRQCGKLLSVVENQHDRRRISKWRYVVICLLMSVIILLFPLGIASARSEGDTVSVLGMSAAWVVAAAVVSGLTISRFRPQMVTRRMILLHVAVALPLPLLATYVGVVVPRMSREKVLATSQSCDTS